MKESVTRRTSVSPLAQTLNGMSELLKLQNMRELNKHYDSSREEETKSELETDMQVLNSIKHLQGGGSSGKRAYCKSTSVEKNDGANTMTDTLTNIGIRD